MGNLGTPLKFRASDLYRMLQEMEQRLMDTLAHALAEWATTRYVEVTWDGVIAPRVTAETVHFKEVLPENFQWPLGVVGLIQWAGESTWDVVSSLEDSVVCPAGKLGQCLWVPSVRLITKSVEKNFGK